MRRTAQPATEEAAEVRDDILEDGLVDGETPPASEESEPREPVAPTGARNVIAEVPEPADDLERPWDESDAVVAEPEKEPETPEDKGEAAEPGATPETTDITEADIARVRRKYGDGPQALLEKIARQDKFIARRDEEIGALRKQVAPASTPETPGDKPDDGSQAPQVDTPADTTAPDGDQISSSLTEPEPEDEGFLGYDPSGKHSPDGWPIADDGEEYVPVDEFGVPFTPESRWVVRMEELTEEEGGNVARATARWNLERATEERLRQSQVEQKVGQIEQAQVARAAEHETSVAQWLGTQGYTEEVSRATATAFRRQAEGLIKQAIKDGTLPADLRRDPNLIRDAIEVKLFALHRAGTLDAQVKAVAAQLAKSAVPAPATTANGNVAPTGARNGAARAARPGTPSVTTAEPGKATQLTEAQQKLVNEGWSPEDAIKHTAEEFSYE